jgi:Holliday junction resolvase RusA-like endonuclease
METATPSLLDEFPRRGEPTPPEAHTGAPAPDLLLVVQGDPVPWTPTLRNQKTGNRFLPARQEQALGRIRDAWLRAERSGLAAPFIEKAPLVMSAEFYLKRPKSHCGTGRNAGLLKPWAARARPTGRPDFSNLCKLIEDALTSLAWVDDDQIVGYREPVGKFFAMPGEMPRSILRIWQIGPAIH